MDVIYVTMGETTFETTHTQPQTLDAEQRPSTYDGLA